MRGISLIALVAIVGFVDRAAASDPVTIGSSIGARQPQAAVDGDAHIHLTFGAGNKIYYTSSTDGGDRYREPIELATLPKLALGMRRGPRIAVGDGFVVITAIGGQTGGGRDGDLLAWRSRDRGKSWQEPVRVNDVLSSAREGLHGMAAGPKGGLYCVWLDLRSKGTKIFGSRSSDGGETWSQNVPVYQSPDGSVCECCHPSVVYDDRGGLYVMWRNSIGGNRDMFLARSSDGGETFAHAVKLGSGSWELDSCPMDGGAIAAAPGGKLTSIWRRDKRLFLTTSEGRDEQQIGAGQQPWVAADQRGVYAVWLAERPGELSLSIRGGQPMKLADRARDPVVAAGNNGPVVVAWEEEQNQRPLIRVKTIGSQDGN